VNGRKNVEFISRASADMISSALLELIDGREGAPLEFDGALPLSIDLRTLFRADLPHREILKGGITTAINNWTTAHPLEGLRQLALAAAYVRASEAVPSLVRLIDSGRLRDFRSWAKAGEELKDVLETVVRVIAGFAPMSAVRFAFERWLFDARFQPRYAAVLATGLCNCRPSEYRQYLLLFWKVAESYPGAYEIDGVIREIVRAVGVTGIVEDLDTFDLPLFERVMGALAGYPESAARIEASDDGEVVLAILGSALNFTLDLPDRRPSCLCVPR